MSLSVENSHVDQERPSTERRRAAAGGALFRRAALGANIRNTCALILLTNIFDGIAYSTCASSLAYIRVHSSSESNQDPRWPPQRKIYTPLFNTPYLAMIPVIYMCPHNSILRTVSTSIYRAL